MKRKRKKQCENKPGKFLIVLLIIFSFLYLPAFADVVVVTGKPSPVTQLSQSDLKNIFFGKIVKWPDGSKINLAILKKNSETHQIFAKRFLKKSVDQFDRWWRQMVFTGKGTLPKFFKSENELIEFIKKNQGTIGYVDQKNVSADVQVIEIN